MRKRISVALVALGAVAAWSAAVPGQAATAARHVPAGKSAIAARSSRASATAAVTPSVSGVGLYVEFDLYDDICGIFNTNSSNWGSCRNQDEALQNDWGSIVWIYYSPNYKGAWACLPAWESYFDLNHSDQEFSNGAGDAGYNQQVWENVASSKFGTGTCSNPMPGGQYFPPPS